MYLTLEEYSKHKQICEERKRIIEKDYNEILKQTSPVGTVTTQRDYGGGRRNVNAVIVDASTSFKNFVMYALYGAKTKWAKSDVIMPLLRKNFTNSEELEKVAQQYRDKLDIQTDDIFSYIFDSNYEKEIGRALSDWGELGTGCWEYIEQDSSKTPFTTRYVPLNCILFNEDVQGEPSIIFRYQFNYNKKQLREKYPNANIDLIKSKDEDIEEFVTVIECVMPHIGSDGVKTYEWILFDESLRIILQEKEMTYNPYTVFRFMMLNTTCWGMGLGMLCLDSYERINYYENLRARQSARIVEPPLAGIGDKALMENFSFEPNALNYLGDSITGRADVYPINTTGNLLPTDRDIERYTNIIQQIHFNNPFGSVDNKTTRAVEEVQYRMQLLQQKFSDAVSNLYSEVLIPSFMKPKVILEEKGIVEVIDEDRYFKPRFINLLTKTIEYQDVENIIQFNSILQNLFPSDSPFVLKATETINKISNSLAINKKLIEKEEVREENKNKALEQALAQQRLASQGQEGGM